MQQTVTFNSDTNQEHPRHRSNSYDVSHTKRLRTGSISGRLRTASDLEELGYIDKKQKGLIKDLIISGDTVLQGLLDKYERGDGKELLDLINQGYLGRKESIDLLDGLDFDFMNGFRSDEEEAGDLRGGEEGAGDRFDNFDFQWQPPHPSTQTIGGGHLLQPSQQIQSLPNQQANRMPVPPPIATSHPLPGMAPLSTSSSIRSPTNAKITPPNHLHQTIGGAYVKPRTLSEVAMDMMDKRKESFDALNISDMIFDDLVGGAAGNHSSGTETELGLLEELLYDPSNPQQRRSMRFDSFADAFAHHSDSFGSEFGNGGDDVDLSAYATLAQSLQNNKTKHQNKDSSKLNLKIKLESNKAAKPAGNLAGNSNTGMKLNKGLLLPTTASISSAGNTSMIGGGVVKGLTPGSAVAGGIYSATGFPSSSAASNSLLNNGSKAKFEIGSSPGSELRRTLGFSGSISTPSSLPGQKPIVTTSGFIGAYTPDQRKLRIERFLEKRTRRVWTRKVKYDVRKNFADSRLRIKGRFVKKEDEDMMRELMTL